MVAGGDRSRTHAWLWGPALLAAVVAGEAAWGQQGEDLALARTYGSGVHAYFSGDFERSYDDLTAMIEAGSEDPRSRYFRGLSALRLGRLDEAEADFSAGAALEARALGGWPVSRSLERVQGPDRIRLEHHRVRARVAFMERERTAERQRYSGIEEAQPSVRRDRRPAPLPEPAADGSNPFAEPDAGAAPAREPAAPAAPTPPIDPQGAGSGTAADAPIAPGNEPEDGMRLPPPDAVPAAEDAAPASPAAPAPVAEDPFEDRAPAPAADAPAESAAGDGTATNGQ